MITSNNLRYHELICLNVKIVDSKIESLVGSKGKVVMETKNMIYFNDGRSNLAAPKSACKFEFTLPSGQLTELPGSLILGRPEVRLSKLR